MMGTTTMTKIMTTMIQSKMINKMKVINQNATNIALGLKWVGFFNDFFTM